MKNLYLLFLLFFTLQLAAQKNNLISSKPLNADSFIGIDQFDNIFYTSNNTLYKNDIQKNYNNFQLGELTSVDITNPFKIVLFYKGFNTVVLIDNNLNETDRITFNFNTSFVSKNIKNKLWVFNRDSNQLIVYNFKKNRTEFKSPPLNFKVTSLKSNINDGILLSKNHIQKIDYLGNLTEKILIKGVDSFNIFKDNLVVNINNELFSLDSKGEKKTLFKEKVIKDFYFKNNDFYIFDGTNINHFKIDKIQ